MGKLGRCGQGAPQMTKLPAASTSRATNLPPPAADMGQDPSDLWSYEGLGAEHPSQHGLPTAIARGTTYSQARYG